MYRQVYAADAAGLGEPWRCAPWHRSPDYDLRREPYDHPDFTRDALSEDLCPEVLIAGDVGQERLERPN